MSNSKGRIGLLVGGSGLIGNLILQRLLESEAYSSVVSFVRKKLPISHSKLDQQVIDFDRLSDYSDLFRGDDLFCSLGTTIKKAKTREAFRRVDFTYTYEAAKVSSKNLVKKILLVSSIGADPHSRVFYSKVKGEIEAAVSQLPFEEIHIFRPSVLVGHRNESRPLEEFSIKLVQPLTSLLIGPLRRYRPISAKTVADAMVQTALKDHPGHHVYESDVISQIP